MLGGCGPPGWMAGDRLCQRGIKHLKLGLQITGSIAMEPAVLGLKTTGGSRRSEERKREKARLSGDPDGERRKSLPLISSDNET